MGILCRMLALSITLALCSLAAASLIWRYDLYDKEPWWAMLLAAAMGGGGMYFVGDVQEWIGGWVGSDPARFAIVAAGSEETLKLLCVVVVARIIRGVFNDPVDGVIYGSLVGFGCAFEESIAYFIDPVSRPWGPPTEVIRILGHLIFGGLAGAGVGFIRCSSMGRFKATRLLVYGFTAAVALHFAWDVLAARMYVREFPSLVERAAQVVIMLAGMIAYGSALVIAWTAARERFRGEHWRRLLKPPSRIV